MNLSKIPLRYVLLTIVGLIIIIVSVDIYLNQIAPKPEYWTGSLFVSDAGRSHGGFEYNAEWDATLTIKGTTGNLKLTLRIGLGDVMTKHEYLVADFRRESDTVSMKIDGQTLVLIWVENDTIWNHEYDRYYIASWGSDSPRDEIRGTISPTIFTGLAPHYYEELRLMHLLVMG